MKIFRDGSYLDYAVIVSKYKQQLKNETVIIESLDHIDHIALYIAWMEVGGRILVRAPMLPSKQKEELDKQLAEQTINDCVFLHTSGTTGSPKLVSFNTNDFKRITKKSEQHLDWSSKTSWLNFIPPFTSGFWHIVLPAIVKHNCKIVLSNKQTLKDDFQTDVNATIFIPGLIDQFRIAELKLPLEKFNIVASGASQLLPRHAKYIFDNGCTSFNHIYGSTEIGSPVLGHRTSEYDDTSCYLELDKNSKIIDDELIYNGTATADLFEIKKYVGSGLVQFKGRSNDIVKVNGYQCSLLLIENHLEEMGYGDCLAVPKHKAGSDYIELMHTEGDPDKDVIKEMLVPYLPPCNIPLKYSKIDSVPRNSLNKKIRNALQTNL